MACCLWIMTKRYSYLELESLMFDAHEASSQGRGDRGSLPQVSDVEPDDARPSNGDRPVPPEAVDSPN